MRRPQPTYSSSQSRYRKCLCGCGKVIDNWNQYYFNATCRKRVQRDKDRAAAKRDEALESGHLVQGGKLLA